MADFPAIEPASRALTFGDYPQLTYASISGGDVRFLQGTKRITQVLSLGYQYLSEANAQLILDHYAGQEGSLIGFDLPAIIWLGYSTPPVSAVDYQWRYAGPFDVAIAAPIQYSMTIELVATPIP
jgi:hypothetical protein